MSAIKSWCLSKAASTKEELEAGDGCHIEEASALSDYFSGDVNAKEAAERITAPITNGARPKEKTYRLWGLLCEALVELGPEKRRQTQSLLASIQALSPCSGIEWSQLPGFGNMWYDLYRSHFHGSSSWEKHLDTLSEQYKKELRKRFDIIGTAEAEMYVGGPQEAINQAWGYDTLSLICSRRPGLDILLSEVHAWLKVASTKLKEDLKPAEIRRFDQAVAGSDSGAWESVTSTMEGHWKKWKEMLLELSRDGSGLSDDGRSLAAKCYKLM